MRAPSFRRDYRIATVMMIFGLASLITSNLLVLADLPYVPLRFALVLIAAVTIFATVIWIVAKHRPERASLRMLQLAAALFSLALALQVEPIRTVGNRLTGLVGIQFQNAVADTLSELGMGLVIMIMITSFISASKDREEATARADQLDEASASLRASEARFRKLADSTAATLVIYRGRELLYVNHRVEENSGYTVDEVMNMKLDELVAPDSRAKMAAYADARMKGEKAPERYELEILRKDGQRRWNDVTAVAIEMDDGPAVLGTAFDITERKRAEEELLAKQRLLIELLAEHDRERQLIAYEIHDGVAQDLTAALMMLESADVGESSANSAREMRENGMALLEKAVREVRHLISGLRPPILEEQGITAAIEYLIHEQDEPSETLFAFEHQLDGDEMSRLVEGNLFRIAQEAIANIRRHSEAQRARIALSQQGHRIHLEIQDWGIGFDPDKVSAEQFGLRGIRDRAKAIGGHVEIDSRPGDGTRIRVDLPSLVK